MATPMEEEDVPAAAAPAGATPMEEEEVPAAAAPAPAPVDSGAGEDDTKVVAAAPPADSDDARLQAAEEAIKECPDDYERNVEYILCLRKSGNIEKLRAARENMYTHFPLSPKMWQEWVQDEIAALSTSNQTFGDIEKIFEHGVKEFLVINLWCDYIGFVWRHDQSVSSYSPAGLRKMRYLFERAISAGGLHVAEGGKLWARYTAYEMSFLKTIPDGNEERAKQVQHIRTLLHRQLSVPLADMESTLAEYKSWEAEHGNENDQGSDFDGVPSNIVSAYEKAKDMYNERMQYEHQISCASEDDKLEEFLKYIKFEESKGDPARVQVLFERAVSDLPDSSVPWTEYTRYLDRALKVPSVLRNVYHRATRNCPGVSELWVRYMLCLERIDASEEELEHVFDQATEYCYDTAEERLDIYRSRVDSLRRRKYGGLDFELIRQTFKDACEFLEEDDLVPMCSYWARLEGSFGNGVAGARQVWEYALTLKKWEFPSGKIWQHYISMEIEMGYINRARSLYKRCYRRKFYGSGSEDICNAWIRFEREFGTLDDYDQAVTKVARFKEVSNSGAQEGAEIDQLSSDLSDSSYSS